MSTDIDEIDDQRKRKDDRHHQCRAARARHRDGQRLESREADKDHSPLLFDAIPNGERRGEEHEVARIVLPLAVRQANAEVVFETARQPHQQQKQCRRHHRLGEIFGDIFSLFGYVALHQSHHTEQHRSQKQHIVKRRKAAHHQHDRHRDLRQKRLARAIFFSERHISNDMEEERRGNGNEHPRIAEDLFGRDLVLLDDGESAHDERTERRHRIAGEDQRDGKRDRAKTERYRILSEPIGDRAAEYEETKPNGRVEKPVRRAEIFVFCVGRLLLQHTRCLHVFKFITSAPNCQQYTRKIIYKRQSAGISLRISSSYPSL